MSHDPQMYLAAAAGVATTGAATVASNPQMAIDLSHGGLGAALLLVLWRLASLGQDHLREMKQHREAHRDQWRKADEHRAAERDYWRSKRQE